MKFLNLNTGYSFDGLWKDNQNRGYIFWFPNEQSIDLTYTMPIAILTENDTPLTLTIEDNDIFSFITSDEIETSIDGYVFNGKPNYQKKIEKTEPVLIDGTKNSTNYKYVHVVNLACCSANAGEYVCRINIGNEGYIRVGADFYGEHEPIYINLSNMGVEIPTTVQKAIYDSNVHEDLTDNILINRKFKELMSNYWDVVANKGSYKSLLNSLKWFEWNDQLKIREVYKHNEAGKNIFSDKDIATSLNANIEENINNFIKTTYISLYCVLQNETPNYDNEYNPVLEQAVFKWAKTDIQLKLALFAKFFGIYFLPMHLSILHAGVEDTVFTNTIKTIHSNEHSRTDSIGCFDYVKWTNKQESYGLTNIRAQVTKDTTFGVRYPNTNVFGVDIFPTEIETEPETQFQFTEEELKTFSEQYYTGPGAIIPISLVIPNVGSTDFIKQTIIEYTDDTEVCKKLYFYDVFSPVNNEIHIDFNFLAKTAKKYTISMSFVFGSSKTITKHISFDVEVTDNLNINIYKVQAKDDSNGFNYTDFRSEGCSKYMFKIQNSQISSEQNDNSNLDLSKSYYLQYLPYLNTHDNNYTGIKLNRTIVIDVNNIEIQGNETSKEAIINKITNSLKNDYLVFYKYKVEKRVTTDENDKSTMSFDITDQVSYIVCVSKKFFASITDKELQQIISINNKSYNCKVIRNDFGFYPQFHTTVLIGGDTIDKYTIKPYEAICCVPEIMNGNTPIQFNYGHMITESEWTFYNHLTNETILHPASSQQPFIASTKKLLEPGYYDITFKYSLNNGTTQECKLNSAFRIK